MNEYEIKKKIIGFFRGNEASFISGEDISNELGFSRASVWKYINKLREEGYNVEAVSNLGYKLISSPDKLYGYDFSNGLKTKNIGKKSIYHYDSIDSTNDKAYELAEGGEPEGTLVIAEAQTKGKGRIGRKWLSPRAGGVYVSLILRPDTETDEVPAVTLIAALSIIRAIKKTCGLEAKMKWPNDIFISGKKVCGILAEMKAQPDRVDFLVLGIGINVNTSGKKLPPEGTSLKSEAGSSVSRSELLRNVLLEIEKDYTKFRKEGFAALRDECKKFSMVIGENVKIDEHNRQVKGLAVDIDEKGALAIKLKDGSIKRVFSGDVILAR